VELNDRLLLAFVGLGLAQHQAGREHDASATFDLAAGLAPNSTLLVSETARLHLRGRTSPRGETSSAADEREPSELLAPPEMDELLAEALHRNELLIRRSPARADLHYRQALLLRHGGDSRRSIASLQQAVRLAASFSKAQAQLGVALHEARRADEALEAFRAALTVRADDVERHYQLALLFSIRGQFDLALDRVECKAAGQGDADAMQHNLALALQNIAMVDRVAATWNALAELSPDTALLDPARFGKD
jgi:tetratricopeptide (TPR) repeat protein